VIVAALGNGDDTVGVADAVSERATTGANNDVSTAGVTGYDRQPRRHPMSRNLQLSFFRSSPMSITFTVAIPFTSAATITASC
jgi:hypothetical protein